MINFCFGYRFKTKKSHRTHLCASIFDQSLPRAMYAVINSGYLWWLQVVIGTLHIYRRLRIHAVCEHRSVVPLKCCHRLSGSTVPKKAFARKQCRPSCFILLCTQTRPVPHYYPNAKALDIEPICTASGVLGSTTVSDDLSAEHAVVLRFDLLGTFSAWRKADFTRPARS